MKSIRVFCFAALSILVSGSTGCDRKHDATPERGDVPRTEPIRNLQEARRGFQTRLTRKEVEGTPVPQPPPEIFRIVKYQSPVGELPAYVSVSPKGGLKRPAIIWLVGGFDNSIGEGSWVASPPSNDQSARAFREAGVVTMFPCLRGGNTGPGYNEGFYGEVNDVLAAADYLARQEYVDPNRIYLGGHSTGGTLALLVAECSNHFRAVFSFGPVGEARTYGGVNVPFDVRNKQEAALRAPARWLNSIQRPVFVFEGTSSPGNIGDLVAMSRSNTNTLVHFYPVTGASHFSILAPITRLVAQKILMDNASLSSITFTEKEVADYLAK